jgi:oligopeptide/dipeptide ABC transporter ATP-binding protein
VGEPGCGKSITALSILQLVPQPAGYYAGGSVVYQGQDLLRLPEAEKRRLRGREISMIFQEPMTSLNPVLTVGYQLMEPLLYHRRLSQAEARRKALELLDQVHLPDPPQRLHEYPHQLSGGMKQRVMIAIAMACEPGLLIADEPTTALDVTVQAEILELMKTLQNQKGTAILLITHDLGIVAEVADRVAVMYAGRIVEVAPADEMFADPRHPYTRGLLAAIPSASHERGRLVAISGTVPELIDPPPSCRFAGRCPFEAPACLASDPTLATVGDGHEVACFIHHPPADADPVPSFDRTVR